MRVVVLCAEPESAERDPESVSSILRDLGCDVVLGRFDLGLIDDLDLHRRPASIVIVDAGEEIERGQRSLRKVGEFPPLVDVPSLLAVTLPRLPALVRRSHHPDLATLGGTARRFGDFGLVLVGAHDPLGFDLIEPMAQQDADFTATALVGFARLT